MAKILVFLIFGLLGFVEAIENDEILKNVVDDLIRIGNGIEVVHSPNIPPEVNHYGYLIEQLYQTGFILNEKYPSIFVSLIDSIDQENLQKFIGFVLQMMKEFVGFGKKCIELSTNDEACTSSRMNSIPDNYCEINFSLSYYFNSPTRVVLPLNGNDYITRSVVLYSFLLGLCGDTDAVRRLRNVNYEKYYNEQRKEVRTSTNFYAQETSWRIIKNTITRGKDNSLNTILPGKAVEEGNLKGHYRLYHKEKLFPSNVEPTNNLKDSDEESLSDDSISHNTSPDRGQHEPSHKKPSKELSDEQSQGIFETKKNYNLVICSKSQNSYLQNKPQNFLPSTQSEILDAKEPQNTYPQIEPQNTNLQIEPQNTHQQIEPQNTNLQIEPQNTHQQIGPQKTYPQIGPQKTYHQKEPQNTYPLIEPQNTYHQIEPQNTYPLIEPQSTNLQIEPQNTYHQIEPKNTYPLIEPQNTYPLIEPQNTYPQIEPQNTYHQIEPQNTYHQIEPQNTHHQIEPHNGYNQRILKNHRKIRKSYIPYHSSRSTE